MFGALVLGCLIETGGKRNRTAGREALIVQVSWCYSDLLIHTVS